MARKSKKGRKAQIADSSSVLQSRENLKPQTQAPETKRQKKKNRPSAGSRKNKHKSAASPKAQIAKLDLPDGYRHSNQQAKKSNIQNRSRKMNNPQPAHAPQGQAQDPEEPETMMPWELDPKYPKPLNDYCAWGYDRSTYRSMPGLDIEDELNKQLTRSRRRQLRLPSPQMTEEEMKALHKQYWDARESGLFRARLANMNHSGSNKLFIANSAVDGEISSVNDNSILIQLLKISELGRMIIDFINPSIGDLTALAMSCKRVAACTRVKFDVWDSKSGVFPLEPYAKKDEEGRIIQTGGFRSNTLIITPTSDEPEAPKKPYETDFRNIIQLCDAITHIPSTFRSIVLDQLQFFDVSMFEIMVNSMPKLTTVTITRCLLLDVTKLRPLLEIIKRHPRRLESSPSQTMSDDPWDKKSKKSKQYTLELKSQAQDGPSRQNDVSKQNGPSKQNGKGEKHGQETATQAQQGATSYIRLDFSPFFFHGPESGPRLGSYGVTYNEPTFNTPKAVFALIIQCRDLADKVGIDLLSDSSSFWGFVRRLPGPDALWATKARETLMTYEYELAMGKKSTDTIWNRFADELAAALTGDNQAHPRIPTAMSRYLPYKMTKGYWRESEKCRMCNSTYPASLFPIRRDACWSCKMERYVETMEDSHLRLWQETALRNWRSGLKRKADFKALISYRKPTLDRALADVRCADLVREYFLDFRPPKQNTAEYDWGRDTPPEQLYCPPPPRGIDSTRTSMARWRWERSPATAAFDYRKGGPQRSHPCRVPISPSDYADLDYGPEAKINFDSRWEWNKRSDMFFKEIWFEEYRAMVAKGGCRGLPRDITDDQHPAYKEELKRGRQTKRYRRQVREIEFRTQNKEDKKLYTLQLHLVEDCLFSMSTLAHKPFNLDKPIPDPGVNPGEYNRLLDEHRRMSNYGFRKDGYFN